MVMTKSHRDIAVFMVQLAGSEEVTELHLIREIADKTKELLDQLRDLSEKAITVEEMVFLITASEESVLKT
ncbi:unnamed protein product [Timema podura]|uniref:Uncharacterized protein n=1 Tax=Timema podura TaxID=61482 RepID=A0ABN7PAF5_TIMPD|nr:unnamed protein product [Timema podura]